MADDWYVSPDGVGHYHSLVEDGSSILALPGGSDWFPMPAEWVGKGKLGPVPGTNDSTNVPNSDKDGGEEEEEEAVIGGDESAEKKGGSEDAASSSFGGGSEKDTAAAGPAGERPVSRASEAVTEGSDFSSFGDGDVDITGDAGEPQASAASASASRRSLTSAGKPKKSVSFRDDSQAGNIEESGADDGLIVGPDGEPYYIACDGAHGFIIAEPGGDAWNPLPVDWIGGCVDRSRLVRLAEAEGDALSADAVLFTGPDGVDYYVDSLAGDPIMAKVGAGEWAAFNSAWVLPVYIEAKRNVQRRELGADKGKEETQQGQEGDKDQGKEAKVEDEKGGVEEEKGKVEEEKGEVEEGQPEPKPEPEPESEPEAAKEVEEEQVEEKPESEREEEEKPEAQEVAETKEPEVEPVVEPVQDQEQQKEQEDKQDQPDQAQDKTVPEKQDEPEVKSEASDHKEEDDKEKPEPEAAPVISEEEEKTVDADEEKEDKEKEEQERIQKEKEEQERIQKEKEEQEQEEARQREEQERIQKEEKEACEREEAERIQKEKEDKEAREREEAERIQKEKEEKEAREREEAERIQKEKEEKEAQERHERESQAAVKIQSHARARAARRRVAALRDARDRERGGEWAIVTDPQTGQRVYRNRVTGEETRSKPTDLMTAEELLFARSWSLQSYHIDTSAVRFPPPYLRVTNLKSVLLSDRPPDMDVASVMRPVFAGDEAIDESHAAMDAIGYLTADHLNNNNNNNNGGGGGSSSGYYNGVHGSGGSYQGRHHPSSTSRPVSTTPHFEPRATTPGPRSPSRGLEHVMGDEYALAESQDAQQQASANYPHVNNGGGYYEGADGASETSDDWGRLPPIDAQGRAVAQGSQGSQRSHTGGKGGRKRNTKGGKKQARSAYLEPVAPRRVVKALTPKAYTPRRREPPAGSSPRAKSTVVPKPPPKRNADTIPLMPTAPRPRLNSTKRSSVSSPRVAAGNRTRTAKGNQAQSQDKVRERLRANEQRHLGEFFESSEPGYLRGKVHGNVPPH